MQRADGPCPLGLGLRVDAVQQRGPGHAAFVEAVGNRGPDLGDPLGNFKQVEGAGPDLPVILESGQDGGPVLLEARSFSLVIGADGVHSNIRRLAFGPEDGFARGLGVYASIFTTPNFAGLDRAGLLYSTPGRTAGLFAAGGVDRAIAQMYFTAPTLRYDPRDTAGQREIVATHFAGLGWQVPRLLAEMETASDFYFDTTSQIHMDSWSNGRVALIGDAGYAAGPGGNGTGNAVVAACILAGELAAAHGDHRAAFGSYERRLRGYIAGGQKQAAGGQAFLAPATWNKIRQRNLFFKILPYLPIKGLISRVATRTATAITVPDYGPVPR